MRIILLIWLLSGWVSNSFSNDSITVVSGRVTDSQTGEALTGASVIYASARGVITDNNGQFQFSSPPGKLNLRVRYVGYESFEEVIQLVPGEEIFLEIKMARLLNEIEQIVVSATKSEQKISDLTVSMSLIKPYVLNENHISDPEELMNKSPGIEVLDGQASIRGGSGFSYGAGSRVLALIDGLPMLSADAGNIKWQFLPLENLSQVEIIKGASSVLYGSSALNGIINFRTVQASEKPRTRFYAETGIYGKPDNRNWAWWDSPRVFSNTSFGYVRKIGHNDVAIGSGLQYSNGYRRLNDEKLGRLSIRFAHTSQKISKLVYGMAIQSGITQKNDFVLWENATDGALKQSESTAREMKGTFLAIDPFLNYSKGNLDHDLRLRIQSTTNRFEEASHNNSDAMSVYSEYRLRSGILKVAELHLGITEDFSVINSPFYGNHNRLNFASYLQLGVDAGKRLKIVTGLRLEQNWLDSEPGDLVPIIRTGINYTLAEATFLRASFGQGYRYPSIAEKYAATTLGSVRIFPNPEIRPEYGWNSEIGLKQGFMFGSVTGMTDLSLFYLRNRDMIEYVFGLYQIPDSTGFDLGFQSSNIENSRVYGLEWEFVLNFRTGIFNHSLVGGYMYINPVEYNPISHKNTGEYLKYRKKHSAKLSVGTRFLDFDAGLSMYIRSSTLSIDRVFLDELTRENFLPGFYEYWNGDNNPYILCDVYAGYHVLSGYRLSFSVKNLFNREYMGRPGDIQPQRNFSIRFTKQF